MMMTTLKYVLMLPVAASLLGLPTAAQAQGCGGNGPQGWWCRQGCGGSGPQAPGCPQPYYYQQRGYDRDDDRRYDYRERRYDERRSYSRYRRDPCWQLSPYGNYQWVCR